MRLVDFLSLESIGHTQETVKRIWETKDAALDGPGLGSVDRCGLWFTKMVRMEDVDVFLFPA